MNELEAEIINVDFSFENRVGSSIDMFDRFQLIRKSFICLAYIFEK